MKELLFIFIFTLSVNCFAQTKQKEDLLSSKDTILVNGSYFSIDQNKTITYQIPIKIDQLKNLDQCYGYVFKTTDGIMFAYTPCGDYSLGKLVVLDKDKFIEFLKVNRLSFK